MKTEYNTAHADLMLKWKELPLHQGQVFIEDGIIDIDKYVSSKNKVLILLKEAYGEDNAWSLADIIKNIWKGPKYKIFWTISYWLYLINKTTKTNIPLFPSSEKELNECREYLLSSAIVNIKKSSGQSTSNQDDLMEYINEDRELLRRQIEIVNPSIIICGYTKDFFDLIWNKNIHAMDNTELIYTTEGITVIDFWHPSNQYPDKLCYYALGALYQKTLI